MAEISFLRSDAAAFFVTLRDHARGERGDFDVNRMAARPVSYTRRGGHPHRRPHMRTGAVVTQEPRTDSLTTRRGVIAGVGLVGCIVNQISDGTIDCPCHGSQYSITTGDVVAGPAPRPLPAKQIRVSGGSIFLA